MARAGVTRQLDENVRFPPIFAIGRVSAFDPTQMLRCFKRERVPQANAAARRVDSKVTAQDVRRSIAGPDNLRSQLVGARWEF